MSNNIDFPQLKPDDFTEVGVVANTCNKRKLKIAINEALEFDLIHTFCYEFIKSVLDNWVLGDLTDAQATELTDKEKMMRLVIRGGEFIGKCGKLKNFAGVKKIWTYYAYSKYVHTNSNDDTPQGLAQKTNSFGIPLDTKHISAIATKYKNMGKDATEHTLMFICLGKQWFDGFDDCGCYLPCGCYAECTCNGKPKKVQGFKFKRIEK